MSEKTPLPNALNVMGDGKEKLKRTVDFLVEGEVRSFDRDAVMEDLGVVDIVRIQSDDFPKIDPTPGWRFAHFNIKKTVNRPAESDGPQRKYLIVKIEKGGIQNKGPVLSLDGALIAECVEAVPHLSYEELTADQFAQSLEGMRDVSSLQDEMVKRYGQVRGLSRQQTIEEGLGYTLFKILGPAPTSNVVR